MPIKSILAVAVVTGLILLIPLIAMQFTTEVNWSPFDFIVMGGFLFVTGLLLDFAIRKAGKYRAAAILGILVLFLYIWAGLAVGIFTNWGS